MIDKGTIKKSVATIAIRKPLLDFILNYMEIAKDDIDNEELNILPKSTEDFEEKREKVIDEKMSYFYNILIEVLNYTPGDMWTKNKYEDEEYSVYEVILIDRSENINLNIEIEDIKEALSNAEEAFKNRFSSAKVSSYDWGISHFLNFFMFDEMMLIHYGSQMLFDFHNPQKEIDKQAKIEKEIEKDNETKMTKKHFKSASKRLRESLKEDGVEVSHTQALQRLAEILFNKPYQELEKTILSE